MADLAHNKSQMNVAISDVNSGNLVTVAEKDVAPVTGDNALFVRSVTIPVVTNNIKQQTQTVTTTAAKAPAVALIDRKSITIYNEGTETVYIGSATVTSSDGLPVPQNTSFSLDVNDNVDIYVIVASGTPMIRILEVS